jgi:hypothetical protein
MTEPFDDALHRALHDTLHDPALDLTASPDLAQTITTRARARRSRRTAVAGSAVVALLATLATVTAISRIPQRTSLGEIATQPTHAPSRAPGPARTTSTGAAPRCGTSTTLHLAAQGVNMSIVIAPKLTDHGQACDPSGIDVEVLLQDDHGQLLGVPGNPAVAKLGSNSDPGNLFFWNNWCGDQRRKVTIVGRLRNRPRTTARLTSPYAPTCVAAGNASSLTARSADR